MSYKNEIFYLSRDMNNEWTFPNELPSHYQSVGSFFVLGASGDGLEPLYNIKYVDNNNLIDIDLNQASHNQNFYIAHIPTHGDFIFLFENIISFGWKPSNTVTNVSNKSDLLYRVKSWNIHKFEKACSEDDIYFVGFANL